MSELRCCYVASVAEFLHENKATWLEKMKSNFPAVCPGLKLSSSQVSAWEDCFDVLKVQLPLAEKKFLAFKIIFEYSLPYEGGRRPDVILLSQEQVLVLEFKRYSETSAAAEDQVTAYARDIYGYHFESRDREVVPVLVLTRIDTVDIGSSVLLCGKNDLSFKLGSRIDKITPCDASKWLDSKYEPLPTIVQAAKKIMRNEELPNIRRAASDRINDAVMKLMEITDYAKANSKHVLALVTGVPGSGKTYLGLQFVYGSCKDIENVNSVYLSGNGPLVEVLADALGSNVFVKSLHNQLEEYLKYKRKCLEYELDPNKGIKPKSFDFNKNIIVFDEGQRAWDKKQMEAKGRKLKDKDIQSEPELMVELAEKQSWCVLLILVGEGQEINTGENSGLGLWNIALENSKGDWVVACPNKLRQIFNGHQIYCEDLFDLTVSLRSHLAGEIGKFIDNIIAGNLSEAKKDSSKIYSKGFDMYVTRNLDKAKEYSCQRYDDNDKARYGLIASSKAFVNRKKDGLKAFGVDNTYETTKRTNIARWFNDDRDKEGHSCCDFNAVVTEFACQGLELDFPIVCWGEDFVWNGSSWKANVSREGKTESEIKDAIDYRINSYRVLLTRGRDGFIVFIPNSKKLDSVYAFLKEAGIKELEQGKR